MSDKRRHEEEGEIVEEPNPKRHRHHHASHRSYSSRKHSHHQSSSSSRAIEGSSTTSTTKKTSNEYNRTSPTKPIETPKVEEEQVDEEFLFESQQEREERLIAERKNKLEAIRLKYASTTSNSNGSDVKQIFEEKKSPIKSVISNSQDEIDSGDYDPLADKQADELKKSKLNLLHEKDKKDFVTNGKEVCSTDYVEVIEVDQPVKQDEEDDMFADDDMFAPEGKFKVKDTSLHILNSAPVIRTQGTLLSDNWDDEEGYYRVILGEILDNRYHVYGTLGKGVFSGVVRAKDGDKDVAIKIIRSNEIMRRAGMKELGFLNKLMENDPEDRKHIIRLITNFEHKGHLCLVFEALSLNLREVLKKYGKNIGLNLKAVRIYAQQILLSLSLLKKTGILHADIKPDNILVSESRNTLKLADLGSASDVRDNEITPYLVSRFYRAPEIILGLPYDHALDIWSVATTLYELYTGKILFPGKSNNQMLKMHMETKGKFPVRMLKKGAFSSTYFDDAGNFLGREVDGFTGNEFIKPTIIPQAPIRDIKSRILDFDSGGDSEDVRLRNAFIDLLERMLVLNPEKRITVSEALGHGFVSGKI